MLTFHPVLNCVHEILRKTHRHVLKSNRLSKVLPSPLRAAFRHANFLKDRLVRSKMLQLGNLIAALKDAKFVKF